MGPDELLSGVGCSLGDESVIALPNISARAPRQLNLLEAVARSVRPRTG